MTAPIGSLLEVDGGVSLHVEQVRDADGGKPRPTLVLVHGIAGSSADWHEVVGGLAPRRLVVTYDQRGHGHSGWATSHEEYSFDVLVRDLDAVVSHVGPDAVDLVGHSMGGVVALRYALERPSRVRSLVLVDTGAAPANASRGLAKVIVGTLIRTGAAVASTVLALRQTRRGTMADPEPTLGRNVRELQTAALGAVDPAAISALGRELLAYPSLVGQLGRIACPTTVVVGERDRTLRRSARTLAAGIPDARLAVVAGGDHSPQVSLPQAWLQAVERHLDRVDLQQPGAL